MTRADVAVTSDPRLLAPSQAEPPEPPPAGGERGGRTGRQEGWPLSEEPAGSWGLLTILGLSVAAGRWLCARGHPAQFHRSPSGSRPNGGSRGSLGHTQSPPVAVSWQATA